MRNFYALCFALFAFTATAQIINFPDANFKAKLLAATPTMSIAQNSSNAFFKIDTNNDGEIQQSEALNVWALTLTNSGITNLAGLEYFTNLRKLYLFQNAISNYNFPQLTNLTTLNISGSVFQNITNPNLVIPTNIQTLGLEGFNFTQEPNLTGFTQLTALEITNSGLTSFTSTNYPALQNLTIKNESLNIIDLSNQNLNNVEFENLPNLISVNLSNSNTIQVISIRECPLLNTLTMPQTNSNLYSLVLFNVALPTVNTSGYPSLNIFRFKAYTLTTPLNFSNNLSLNVFTYRGLPNMYYFNNTNLPNYHNLTEFAIVDTPINGPVNFTFNGQSSVNVFLDNCGITSANIQNLNPSTNQYDYFNLTLRNNVNLASFDATNVAGLTLLNLDGTPISNLDITNCQKLGILGLSNSLLTSLDLSTTSVYRLGIYNSPNITTVNLKNGIITTSNNIFFDLCPNLQSICGDENEIAAIQSKITQYGYTNCFTNSYCTFTTGGTAYQTNGTLRFDQNTNGCAANDVLASNVRVNVSNGTTTETGFTNGVGAYGFSSNAGSYTITPVLENPTYFNLSPATGSVNFPTTASPATRDFCMTANGVKNDLEITLLPLNPARPGFNAKYMLVYKNKGNTTQSGTASLTFPNTVASLVTAIPAVSSQTASTLNWAFTNLLPFETRTIQLNFLLNTPTATPALNGGDVLPYVATVTGASDQTPADNTLNFNQNVVNAYDPNDKTCLEGAVVGTDKIGQYVHYVIRFENTGNFAAQNIIVTDVIDTNKYDVTTLIPQLGSHPFRTRILQNNRVEFVFENINLPFDDANNDGYVAFKIKTKSTLVSGDTFSNSANIFFDYNYPILTNTATTLIQSLGLQETLNSAFAIAQNPVDTQLVFANAQDITIQSVSIYSIQGQLVQVNMHPAASGIDVSALSPGTYLVKVTTEQGSEVVKMVKK
ncbi:T9SS type A sorting domain-containing protein [Flavobacterium sp. N1719]|uniref:T9SS type A sorting domain-containing protein n=1 Tax=Flavobacterium sp. N1719 TaxID=2885633 RepID=UPI002222162C|nr:T9SS type A sorting domain-containing protein [Flavobacterium sp. N1719]